MLTTFKSSCPKCNTSVLVKDAHVGRQVRCPRCKQPFEVANVSVASQAATQQDLPVSETIDFAQRTAEPADGGPATVRPLGKLGRFQLKRVLGQGSFGRVYQAYDPQLDRDVALKVPTFGSDDTSRVRRFLTEAKAAAKLRHPHIVPVYESGELQGQYFIAAQFVSGEPLSQRIKAGPLSFREAAHITLALAEALAYAHSEGIVHRDIKSENIMLDARRQPQIMDFGLAKRTSDDSSATVDGAILGTPAYMSPEQASGNQAQVGPASDQYSLGVVLYEMLTGQRPFSGPPHAVIAKVLSQEPPTPRSLRTDLPSDLQAICQKAMHKEIGGRYASLTDFAADLQAWLNDSPIAARPIGAIERLIRWTRREPKVAWLSLAVAALLVVGTTLSSTLAFVAIGNASQLKTALRDLEDKSAGLVAKEKEARDAELRANEQAAAALAAKTRAERSEQQSLANEQIAQDKSRELEQANAELEKTIASLKAAEDATEVATTKAESTEMARRRAAYDATLAKARNLITAFEYAEAAIELEKAPRDLRDNAWKKLYATAKETDLRIVPLDPFELSEGRVFATGQPELFVVNVMGSGRVDDSFKPDEKVHVVDIASSETLLTKEHARYLEQWNDVLLTYEEPGVGKFDLRERTKLPLARLPNFEPHDCLPIYFLGSKLYFYSLNLRNNIWLNLESGQAWHGPSQRNVAAAKDKFCLGADVRARTSVWLSHARERLSLMTVAPNGTINPIEEFARLSLFSQGATSLSARQLAIAFSDRVEVWTPERQISRLPTPDIGVRLLTLSPDGRLLATWSADDAVQLWNVASGKPTATFESQSEVQNLHFAEDGRLAWISSKGLCIWSPGSSAAVADK